MKMTKSQHKTLKQFCRYLNQPIIKRQGDYKILKIWRSYGDICLTVMMGDKKYLHYISPHGKKRVC